MAFVSVDIPALAQLVAALKATPDKVTDSQASVKSTLTAYDLSTSSVTGVEEVATWAEEEYTGFHKRLAYARWLETSAPGLQSVVTFDEDAIPERSEEQIQQLADRAIELMGEGVRPPPEELVILLRRYGWDPAFARRLMFAHGDGPNLDYIAGMRGGPGNEDNERFLQLYSRTLGGLSHELELEVDLSDVYPSYELVPDKARAWALLASRGNWSAQWLTELTTQMIGMEREDPEIWTKERYERSNAHYEYVATYLDPSSGLELEDPLVWMMDALSRNPDAAADVFSGGDDAPIRVDDDEVDIAGNLRYLTLERGWPQDQGISLALAMGAATSSADSEDLAEDLENLQDIDPVEKKSWYSFGAHLGLDIIGMVPFVGEWADGLNVALSLAEGDYASAAASGAASAPVFGSSATIAKWIHRINKAGDSASAVLTADNLKDLLNELDLEDQDPGTAPTLPVGDEAVFLTSGGHDAWHEKLDKLDPSTTYVLDGGYLLRTDKHGNISDEVGNPAALDDAEYDWIKKHRQ